MTDVLERLTAAMADRYRIERELGASGMATVPNVSAAIQKSLARLPADRFASASDLSDALTKPGFIDTSMIGRIDEAMARVADWECRVIEP